MGGSITLSQVQDKYPRHNLETKLDSGGQKEVFKGEFDGEDIVLKTITAEDWEATKRAELEIRAMKEIDSDIMVGLRQDFQDVIDDHEVFVMVEEFVPGGTLQDKLQEDGPSVELAARVGREVLTVLQEFNEQDFVHRDIKPKNIMVQPDDRVRLLDVGIVRSIGETDTDLTPTDRPAAPGTPGFRAPEQMMNDKDRQDTRTDIFSLGITMFTTMTGVHPFDVDGMDLQEAIQAGTHRNLSDHFPDPDANGVQELEWYVHKMIETKMHRRFLTPVMALDELERVMEEIA
jgi:serine/threonine-protein kinase